MSCNLPLSCAAAAAPADESICDETHWRRPRVRINAALPLAPAGIVLS
jgi:hypothetical protein